MTIPTEPKTLRQKLEHVLIQGGELFERVEIWLDRDELIEILDLMDENIRLRKPRRVKP